MKINADQAVYRIRSFNRDGDKPKNYRSTYQVIDEKTEQVMAQCDRIGKAMFATLPLIDHRQQTWILRPNRKILPTSWTLSDPQDQVAMRFDQMILLFFTNPLGKGMLRLRADDNKERFRLINPDGLFHRIFSAGPLEWHLVQGKHVVARLGNLAAKRPGSEQKGFFAKLKKFLTSPDKGLASNGNDPILPAPVALAMVLLFNEINDKSAG